jgi:ribosome-associated protein
VNVKEEKAKKLMEPREKAIRCARAASDRKALDIVVLDVAKLSSFSDYFVICSGTSSRQVQGIADHLERDLREEGVRPLGSEGVREGHWALIDFGDVIVHVFYEPVRNFYDLESLWSEAGKVAWETEAKVSTTSTA